MLWSLRARVDDPFFNGKRLSAWMAYYPLTEPQSVAPSDPSQLQNPSQLQKPKQVSWKEKQELYRKHMGGENVVKAHEALMHLRERAYPLLLEMLGREPTKLVLWTDRVRQTLAARELIKPPRAYNPRHQSITAFLDLQQVGCDLKSIMPDIEQLAQDPNNEIRSAAEYLKQSLQRNDTSQ